MGGKVLVALLVTGVLGDEVEVLSSDDDGTVHLRGNDGAGQDTTTNGDEAGEGALLVCRSLLVTCPNAVARLEIFAQKSSSRFCPSIPQFLAGIFHSIDFEYRNSGGPKTNSHVPM